MAPPLAVEGIYLQPRLISTSSQARGGALTPDRVFRFLRNTLRERTDTYVTTLFDLYRLAPGFPGAEAAAPLSDPLERASAIEVAFAASVIERSECRAERFLAYIQPYEFEALLFSGIEGVAEVETQWQSQLGPLQQARNDARSPEHINDGPTTHPSARLAALRHPSYQKTLHGPQIAGRIGLEQICAECSHFAAWLTRIGSLRPLTLPAG
jgi:hypothetical protein